MRETMGLARWVVAVALAAMAASGAARADGKVRLDYAYYNPVALLMKDKGWLEQELAGDKIAVEWVLSLGSNKALEFLNGNSIDFGSSAGAAALLARANGNPIKAVYIYSKPEWTALVVRADSPVQKVTDLKDKRIAVTRGTDPHIFLLRALALNHMGTRDVKMVLLQHGDGRVALEKGDVDAWAGLDPYMAQTELDRGSRLFFRNADLNTYGFLNVREAFAREQPALVERVLATYERSRQYALQHPDELKAVLAKAAKLEDPVAAKQIERTDITNALIGRVQRDAIVAAGAVLKDRGVIPPEVNVEQVADQLIEPAFVTKVAARKAAAR